MSRNLKKTALDILVKASPYIVCFVAITVVMNIILDLSNHNFSIPFFYDGGDAAVTLYRSFEMKTDHSFFGFNQLGAPYGANTYDFYVFDIGLFVIQYLIALFSPNFIVGFNIFLIGGAWLNGMAALYSLRRLKFPAPVSVMSAVIYSSLPYFFMRYSAHTYLAYYFAAPLAIVIAIELYREEFVFDFKKEHRKQSIVNGIILFVIGTTGVYYAVFSCLYFLMVAMLRGMEDLKLRSTLPSIKAIGITFLGFVVGVLPSALYWLKHGLPQLFKTRTGFMWYGEVYGLKLTELILPNVHSRIHKFHTLRNSYDEVFGFNESMTASLGLVLTIGLAIAFVYIFRIAKSDKKDILRPVSLLIVASIILAMKGGIGTFLAIFFPFVRSYNRISVFIAFLCAIALTWGLTALYNLLKTKIKAKIVLDVLSLVVLLGIMVGGVYEQSFIIFNLEEGYKILYDNDDEFINDVVSYADSLDPDDDMVDCLFLPYMEFPENTMPTADFLIGYEPMLLCVHSERLGVSFGAPKGRDYSDKLCDVSKSGADENINFAIDNGYDGIIIDFGAIQTMTPELYTHLVNRLGEPDYISSKYAFWSLEDLA